MDLIIKFELKIGLTVAALLVSVVNSLAVPVAQADSYDEQIKALNAQVAQQQSVASELHAKADTLGNKVAGLNAQVAAVNAQLQLNRAKQQQTNARMEEATLQLQTKKAILAENIRKIYQQSSITPIEILASSNNFSDFVDREQYLDRIKEHIQESANAIVALKADLEKQQASLNVQIAQEAGLQATLRDQRNEQAQLLAETQGDESRYQADIKGKNQRIAQLRQQQAAALASASRSAGAPPGASGGSGGACDNGNGNGGYPMKWCNAPQDSIVDSWGMYNRECVSWAAWKRSQIGRPIPGGWGNANQWDERARGAGFRVDGSPEVGAIAQTNVGYWGHVAIVESVQGGTVIVSELNYDVDGHFRYGAYPASYFQYIH